MTTPFPQFEHHLPRGMTGTSGPVLARPAAGANPQVSAASHHPGVPASLALGSGAVESQSPAPLGNSRPPRMLTKAQSKLLDFIIAYQAEQSSPPSFAEMARHMGLKSKSGIHRLLAALEYRGYVRRLRHKARAIEVIEPTAGLHTAALEMLVELQRILDQEPALATRASLALKIDAWRRKVLA